MHIALFCIVAERTKHIHAQRSFRFLAERHEHVRERDVSETTGQQIKGTSASFTKMANIYSYYRR